MKNIDGGIIRMLIHKKTANFLVPDDVVHAGEYVVLLEAKEMMNVFYLRYLRFHRYVSITLTYII